MKALRNGWAEARLSDIGQLRCGKGLPTGRLLPNGYPVCGANGVIGFYNEFHYEDEQILISCRGANSGAINISPKQCFVTHNSLVFELPDCLRDVRRFLIYALIQCDKSKMVSGSAEAQVTIANAEQVTLRLAPLPEQLRISLKIDSLSAKTKRARDHLDHIPRLVEKYKQAILVAAFRGNLTREWRISAGLADDRTEFAGLPRELNGQPLPSSWTVTTIAATATNYDGKRIPVRASDRAVRRGEFPYYGASRVIDTIDDYLFDGDFLLIGEDGTNLVSRSTPIAFLASGRFWVNNHAHVLQAEPDTSNGWLCWYINMIDLVPFVTGTAQPKLTQAALNRIAVPLPSAQEQQEILRRIETAFSWIDRLTSEATSARMLMDHLDQAVLAKAFRGELVRQDPNDEPASILLERIRAERAAAPAASRHNSARPAKRRAHSKRSQV